MNEFLLSLDMLMGIFPSGDLTLDGGKGSGNFGHVGRPGMIGGSASFSRIELLTERRPRVNIDGVSGVLNSVINDPASLREWKPKTLYEALIRDGWAVGPLGKGLFKNIPFKDGGGYGIHFGGDKYFQYHPYSDKSQHKVAYYKMSDSINGVRRYLTDGREFKDNKGKRSKR